MACGEGLPEPYSTYPVRAQGAHNLVKENMVLMSACPVPQREAYHRLPRATDGVFWKTVFAPSLGETLLLLQFKRPHINRSKREKKRVRACCLSIEPFLRDPMELDLDTTHVPTANLYLQTC